MLATEYLKDPHLSLQEIALLLCYSEQSAFKEHLSIDQANPTTVERSIFKQRITNQNLQIFS